MKFLKFPIFKRSFTLATFQNRFKLSAFEMEFQVKKDSVLKWLKFVSDQVDDAPRRNRKKPQPPIQSNQSQLREIDEIADLLNNPGNTNANNREGDSNSNSRDEEEKYPEPQMDKSGDHTRRNRGYDRFDEFGDEVSGGGTRRNRDQRGSP